MYKHKQGAPLLGEKCLECRFCSFDSERKEEFCEARGCVDYARFRYYEGVYDEERRTWR